MLSILIIIISKTILNLKYYELVNSILLEPNDYTMFYIAGKVNCLYRKTFTNKIYGEYRSFRMLNFCYILSLKK